MIDKVKRRTEVPVPSGSAQSFASEILKIVATIKAKKAGALFTEPQYPEAVGKTIATKAGIAVATLDSGATGPEQVPLNYYVEQVMRPSLIPLEKTLGNNWFPSSSHCDRCPL